MKVLITGGTGFIGGATAQRCIDASWDVTLLLRPGSPLPRWCADNAAWISVDLGKSTSAQIRATLPRCDVVIHAAAIRNRWGTSPDEYQQVNVDGTRNLLQAVDGYAQRFIYISSVGVYGSPGVCGITESFPIIPISYPLSYHSSKLLAEQVVLESQERIESVILRPTITYGPGDRDGMITRMARMIKSGKLPRIGRGKNYLHLTYIDDLVEIVTTVCSRAKISGQVYNVCGPEPVRYVDLARGLAEMMNMPSSNYYIPRAAAFWAGWLVESMYRLPGVQRILPPIPLITRSMVQTVTANRSFSCEKAQAELGFTPKIGVAQGLRFTLDWMASTGILPLLPE